MECVFCAIGRGEVPAEVVLEDERMIAFRDLNPQAPQHVLVVPKEHIGSLADVREDQSDLMGHLLFQASQVARMLGLADRGFRTVVNTGPDALQTVQHLHLHVIGGRTMAWPPG